MTPAVLAARRAKVPFVIHDYEHDPAATSYGEEAAIKLAVPAARVFKTLVVDVGGALVVAVLPVNTTLSMKKLARAAGAKRAAMADAAQVERSTGYVLGGVSPLGQKRALRTFIDSSAGSFPSVYVSAGRRGLEISLAATDLLSLTRGQLVDLSV